MKIYNIKDKVDLLGVDLPSIEQFWKLGDLTALRVRENGNFYRANYERGILLYSLVAKYKPQTILEFGTGRGYGCLCMAWAMEDYQIPGHIYTIDFMSPNEVFKWPINWGKGPRIERLSRNEVWSKVAPRVWFERIGELTGFSGQVMSRWQGPRIEFAYIDAGHNYNAVRHDFYSFLEIAAECFGILFDDYSAKQDFGVQRLIDEEVAPYFDAQLIYTDRRWPGGERASLKEPEYGMVWAHSESLRGTVAEDYPFELRQNFLRWYRRYETWLMLRRWIGRILR